MTNTENRRDNSCPLCELRLSETLAVVSRHRTATGTVVYARCECGRLSMWFEPSVLVQGPPQLRAMAHTARKASSEVPQED